MSHADASLIATLSPNEWGLSSNVMVSGFGAKVVPVHDSASNSESSLIVSAMYSSVNGNTSAGLVFVYGAVTQTYTSVPQLDVSQGCGVTYASVNRTIAFLPRQVISLAVQRPDDMFGVDIAADQNLMLISSRRDGGTVHVYQHALDTVWRLIGNVVPQPRTASFSFGSRVNLQLLSAADDVTGIVREYMLLASDPGYSFGEGAVYVFSFISVTTPIASPGILAPNPSGKQRQIIRPPVPQASNNFGYSMDHSDRFLVIGAPYRGDGVVYVYYQTVADMIDSWALYQTLYISFSPIPGSPRWFGSSVSIDLASKLLVVGAAGVNSGQGQVYCFQIKGEKLGDFAFALDDQFLTSFVTSGTPSTLGGNSSFGSAVSVHGNVVMGGAYLANNTGLAVLYSSTGVTTPSWYVRTVELPSDPMAVSGWYGGSVSPAASIVAVGAWFYNTTGAVFVYNESALIPVFDVNMSACPIIVAVTPGPTHFTSIVAAVVACSVGALLVAGVAVAYIYRDRFRKTKPGSAGLQPLESVVIPDPTRSSDNLFPYEDPGSNSGAGGTSLVTAIGSMEAAMTQRRKLLTGLKTLLNRRKRHIGGVRMQEPLVGDPLRLPDVPSHPIPPQRPPQPSNSTVGTVIGASIVAPPSLGLHSSPLPDPVPTALPAGSPGITVTYSSVSVPSGFVDVTVQLTGTAEFVELRVHQNCLVSDVKRTVLEELAPQLLGHNVQLVLDGRNVVADGVTVGSLELSQNQVLSLRVGGVSASQPPQEQNEVRVTNMDGRMCTIPLEGSVGAVKRAAIAQLCPTADEDCAMLLHEGVVLDDDDTDLTCLLSADVVLICPVSE